MFSPTKVIGLDLTLIDSSLLSTEEPYVSMAVLQRSEVIDGPLTPGLRRPANQVMYSRALVSCHPMLLAVPLRWERYFSGLDSLECHQ
jgi:hypothetical protein